MAWADGNHTNNPKKPASQRAFAFAKSVSNLVRENSAVDAFSTDDLKEKDNLTLSSDGKIGTLRTSILTSV
ncbi:hypothetical protein BDM02DRAFT_3120531 [Thelephora ganbajun]|uniref:Uncharacterized protein n=1 Tax=Thelephora ganbajun TaxID=370292 RepID=A0ACB6Z6T1_THEGA|nr:hypothetical protein BDM02DRAFT_3120531 [Thelephora ganbajun]